MYSHGTRLRIATNHKIKRYLQGSYEDNGLHNVVLRMARRQAMFPLHCSLLAANEVAIYERAEDNCCGGGGTFSVLL